MIRDAAVCMLNKPVLDRLAGSPIAATRTPAARPQCHRLRLRQLQAVARGLATRYDKHCLPRPPEGGAAR